MVIAPDEQGYAYKSQNEFKGYDKDILHSDNGFYKLGDMAQIQFSNVLERPEIERLRLQVGASA